MSMQARWATTFNTDLKRWGHISLAAEVALDAGYKYITWNDQVYELTESMIQEVGSVEDLR